MTTIDRIPGYTIREEKTQNVLASGLNDVQLADWWKQHETTYFGLRLIDGCVIEVADTTGWAR
jgi:hypothetical protein